MITMNWTASRFSNIFMYFKIKLIVSRYSEHENVINITILQD